MACRYFNFYWPPGPISFVELLRSCLRLLYIHPLNEEKMKKKTIPVIQMFVLLILILTACSSPAGAANPPVMDIKGTNWKLVSYGAADKPTPAAADALAIVSFGKDGKISGNVGCNSFSGEYSLSADQITYGAIASTLMACAEPRMAQESAVFGLMTGTQKYKVDGANLTLFGPGSDVISFTRVEK
jgi:heat shock protein HslJ